MGPGLFRNAARRWWRPVVYGLIAIGVGLFALTAPSRTLPALVWGFGVLSLAEGVVVLVALLFKHTAVPTWLMLLYALLSIGLGLLAIDRPQVVIDGFLLLLAAWSLLAGGYRVVFALRERRRMAGGWLFVLSGVLAIGFGVMLLRYPATGVLTVTLCIALAALAYGVLQVAAGLLLRRHTQHAASPARR
jgi:uncharacterized membrane protein HdeD (DUF308 family)